MFSFPRCGQLRGTAVQTVHHHQRGFKEYFQNVRIVEIVGSNLDLGTVVTLLFELESFVVRTNIMYIGRYILLLSRMEAGPPQKKKLEPTTDSCF